LHPDKVADFDVLSM